MHLWRTLAPNLARFSVLHDALVVCSAHAFGIAANVATFPFHAFAIDPAWTHLEVVRGGIVTRYPRTACRLKRVGQYDQVLVAVQGMPPFADRRAQFTNSPMREMYRYAPVSSPIDSWEVVHVLRVDYFPQNTPYDMRLWGVPNGPGDCGLPYIDSTGSIVGFHVAGRASLDIAYAVRLSKNDIMDLVEDMLSGPLTVHHVSPQIEHSSGIRIAGTETVGVVSAADRAYMPTESCIRRAPHSAFVAARGVPQPTSPVHLKPFKDSSGAMISPLQIAQASYAKVPPDFWRPLALDMRPLVPNGFSRTALRMLTVEEAVFGCPELHIHGIDARKSTGYFLMKRGRKRRDMFDFERQVVRDRDFLKVLGAALARLEDGPVESFCQDSLKDELRDNERVNIGKTRLFFTMGLENLITSKMITGVLVSQLERDPARTPMAIGINPHSSDWGILYHRLFQPDRKIFAGDMSRYDISLRYRLVQLFGDFLHGYSPDSIRVKARNVALGLGLQIHIVLGALYRYYQGNPSGHFLTSIFGSFCNFVLWTLFLLACGHDPSEAEMSFFGDDSVVSVPFHWRVTMPMFAAFVRAEFGMEYTSPDKSADLPDYYAVQEVRYLARSFVPSVVQGRSIVLAPLNEDCFGGMLHWSKSSPELCEFDPFESTARSLLHEAWHHGPVRYEFYRSLNVALNGEFKYNLDTMSYELMTLARIVDY
jgi:hypothetical protein